MTEQDKDLIPFEATEGAREVRRIWHNGQWYYSVIDLVAILTNSAQPRTYWNKVKARASSEGFEETDPPTSRSTPAQIL